MKNEYLSENRVSLPEIRIRMLDKTLNIRGTLLSLATPVVMGILNVTPDSFYADSRKQNEAACCYFRIVYKQFVQF